MSLSLRDCLTIMGGRSIYFMEYKAAFEPSNAVCKAVDLKIYVDCGATNNDNGFSGVLWESGKVFSMN